ncbi:MAG: GNAT family N-acetyltransferase, partial [Chromatiaceae bacterium]|nr:GNAT family N-acetyltransferase [Chromatiaceae bacterium]
FSLDPREHAPFFLDSPVVERKSGARNICVDVTGGFDSFWESRPRNLKKNIRRYRNRLNDELGDLKMLVACAPADVSSATDRYGILESQGWKARIGTAVHPGNVQGAFYRSFMFEMAVHSRAYVFELYAGDLLLASRLCVSGSDMLVILKTTFDEQLKRYAAGRILLHDMLQYVFDNNLARVVDFYTNATDDQMDWATSSRSMLHASIYQSVATKLIARGLKSAKDFMKHVLPGHT